MIGELVEIVGLLIAGAGLLLITAKSMGAFD